MSTFENTTVAEQVNRNMKTGEIFRKYGIDYCCNGKVSVKTAAEEALANYVSLEKELQKLKPIPTEEENLMNMPPDALIDLIVSEQHEFIKDNIPVIVYYATRVARRNAEAYPELIQIQRLFSEAVIALEAQMKTKESELFPCIGKILKGEADADALRGCGGNLGNRLKLMKEEHLGTIYLFKKIASLTNAYIVPAEVRNPFRILYQQLEEFEKNLYHQFHLQHNILFPKAIQLEQEIFKA